MRTLGQGLAELADDLEEEGRNVPRAALRAMRRYRDEAAKEPMDDILPDRLISLAAVLRDALMDDDSRDALGFLYEGVLGRHVEAHDRLMKDFYGAAMDRLGRLDPDRVQPDANLAEIVQEAAELPRKLQEMVETATPRAGAEFQRILDYAAERFAETQAALPYMADAQRARVTFTLRLEAKEIGATVVKCVREVTWGVVVDAGKIAINAFVGMVLTKLFGIKRPP